MKRLLILLAGLASLSIESNAQQAGFTSADYLMISDAQQQIYLQRMLNANEHTYGVCTEGLSTQQINHNFTNWIRQNPQYLQRTLLSSFSAALIDFCNAKNISIR